MKLTPLLLGLGTGEIILIVLAILLLFGAKRIPELMKSMGKGVKNFKEGMKEVEKAEQKRITAERRARSNELGYFGEVGKRYKNEKVDSVEEIGYYTTQFGITVIYRITLESGYELTWKASSTPHELEDENMEVDKVTFTVKEHGEYKGYKQTVVTRCKFTVKEKERK